MKKYILIFILLMSVTTFAAAGFTSPVGEKSFEMIITNIVEIVQTLLIIASVFYILHAGFLFVTATGRPEQLTKAKWSIGYALIGLLLILSGQVLIKSLKSTVDEIFGYNTSIK